MDAIDNRGVLRFQAFRCADIGRNHESLNQPHAVEALNLPDARDVPVFADLDLPFRQVQGKRRALALRFQHGLVGLEQGDNHVFGDLRRHIGCLAVIGCLGLLI